MNVFRHYLFRGEIPAASFVESFLSLFCVSVSFFAVGNFDLTEGATETGEKSRPTLNRVAMHSGRLWEHEASHVALRPVQWCDNANNHAFA